MTQGPPSPPPTPCRTGRDRRRDPDPTGPLPPPGRSASAEGAPALRRGTGDPRQLRYASAIEGTTLLLLVLVAVPLKHVAGLPAAVRVLGPVHGLAFAFYVWSVVEAAAAGGWSRRDVARLLLAALVPFGGFANLGWLRARRGAAAP